MNGPEPSAKRWAAIAGAGLALVAVMNPCSAWCIFTAKVGNPGGWGILPFAGSSLYFALCGINEWRRRSGRAPLTTTAESLGFFLVVLVGGWMSTWAFVELQMPLLTAPPVFASPDNGWAEHVMPFLPKWAMGPLDEPYASGFYNGLAAGQSIPWVRWILPVAAWSTFAVVLMLAAFGIAGIVSRQWIEHDRLTFPHAEVLLGMGRDFLRQRLFWYGVATFAAVPLWNLLQRAFPVFPHANLFFGGYTEGVEWFTGGRRLQTDLKLGVLGLFYFVHRDIILSMVVFFVLVALEDYGLTLAGVKFEHSDVFQGANSPIAIQTSGALLALVLLGLWSGRHTIRAYFKEAWRPTGEDWSWLSPRATVISLGAGFAGLGVWLVLLGLRSPLALLSFLGTQGLSYVGASRVVAESGLEVGMPIDPTDLNTVLWGTRILAPAGMVALALTACWNYGGLIIPPTSNVVIGERLRTAHRLPRGLFPALLLSAVVGTVAAMSGTLWLAYTHGANNFGEWHYQYHMRIPFDLASEQARNSTGTDWARLGWLGIGAAVMAVLVILRNQVVGWVLHPIGLILGTLCGNPGNNAHLFVFTGVAAWGLKSLLLKMGGVEAYERWKPYFGGLVAGGFVSGAIWWIAAVIYTLATGRPIAPPPWTAGTQ